MAGGGGSGGGNGTELLVGLYPYESRADGDLSFGKGDQMLLLDSSNRDWWYVQQISSGEQGYVPRNFVAPKQATESEEWYAGRISRNVAERLVLQAKLPKGTYLLRERETDSGEYALTIRDANPAGNHSVKHYKIKRLDNGGYFITTRRTFSELSDLVAYYSTTADGLCCQLLFPAPRLAPILSDLSRDTAKNWEIPRDQIQLKRKLGSGNFGEVWYGKWRGLVEVAVKTLKAGTMSQEAFLEEASIMRQIHHPNLVLLYAVCTDKEPLYIVTEYMLNGSLQEFMRKDEEAAQLNLSAQVDIAAMVANGMSHLEERKFVHRDLAARNVLVGEKISGVPLVKVGDFGLARVLMDEDIYEARTGAKFPIKWTAPEAAIKGAFTTKSDVWSFGVLLYEIVTKGQVPYPGMANREVVEQIERGYRMAQPPNCPNPLYELMLKCWDKDPSCRPTFEHLFHLFDDYFVSTQPSYVPASTD